jgi:RNA 3'-terminal phosphate cyclase (ATP)
MSANRGAIDAVMPAVKPSQNSLTAIDVIGRFMTQRLGFAQQAGGAHLLTVR